MKSIVHFNGEDRRNPDQLAGKIHSAICCFHLLRGRAPSTLSAHPLDLQYMLTGVVEEVIFPKGVALRSDENVLPGTLQLIAVDDQPGASSWTSNSTLPGRHYRAAQHPMRLG